MTTTVKAPAFRYHGAKFRIAPWVIQHMPPHTVYIEAFGGAAGVLLQKPRTHGEVYNDIDGDVVNFFRVLRDPSMRALLIEAVAHTPYARAEFLEAYEPSADPVECARRLLIRSEMGFGSAGATKGSTGFRTDCRRSYSTAQHIWAQVPDRISAVGQRFAGVLIEQRDALQVMQSHDGQDTLHYVDPPYLHSTRKRAGEPGQARYYRHEMTDDQHMQLIHGIQQLRGYVLLSGYDSDMYRQHLQGWDLRQKRALISASRGTGIRTECLWLNPAASAALGAAGGLFGGAAA